MRAVIVGGVVAAVVFAVAAYVGAVNGGSAILAFCAGVGGFGVARWWRYEGRKIDRLIADARHPNRQADLDDRTLRTANQAQVRL